MLDRGVVEEFLESLRAWKSPKTSQKMPWLRRSANTRKMTIMSG